MNTRHDRIALALTAGFLVFMIFFGWRFHPMEEIGSAEVDGYVGDAELIREGKLPHDEFRPLLYPIMVAAGTGLTSDGFVAARTISSIFAALFVLTAYLLARVCFGSAVGLIALGAMMVNHNVMRFGVHAATDMTGAAIASMAVVAAIQLTRRTDIRTVVILGFLTAMAYFARYTAIALFPCALVAVAIPVRNRPARVARDVLVLCAATLLFLLPHFLLKNAVFGSPFHSENWRSLAVKLYGTDSSFDGLWSVLVHSPVVLLKSFARELTEFGYRTLIDLGGYGLPGALFAAAALGGAYLVLFRLNAQRVMLLVCLAMPIVTVCLFFLTNPRYMLPILPMCCALCGHFLMSDAFEGSFRAWGRRIPVRAPVVAAFLLAGVLATVREVPIFVSLHPVAEARAARLLESTEGSEVSVLGSSRYLYRQVGYRYGQLRLSAEELGGAEAYYDELERVVRREEADFVIVGRLTGRGIPPEFLAGERWPPYLTVRSATPDVVVYAVSR